MTKLDKKITKLGKKMHPILDESNLTWKDDTTIKNDSTWKEDSSPSLKMFQLRKMIGLEGGGLARKANEPSWKENESTWKENEPTWKEMNQPGKEET